MAKFSTDKQPSDGKRKEGRKKRKLMSEVLMTALNRKVEHAAENGEAKPTRSMAIIAQKLVTMARDGDIQAIKECFDRTEGKAAQAVMLQGDEDNPIVNKVVLEIID